MAKCFQCSICKPAAKCFQHDAVSTTMAPTVSNLDSIVHSPLLHLIFVNKNLTFPQNVVQVRTQFTSGSWDFSLPCTHVWNHYCRKTLSQKAADSVYFTMSYQLTSQNILVFVCSDVIFSATLSKFTLYQMLPCLRSCPHHSIILCCVIRLYFLSYLPITLSSVILLFLSYHIWTYVPYVITISPYILVQW